MAHHYQQGKVCSVMQALDLDFCSNHLSHEEQIMSISTPASTNCELWMNDGNHGGPLTPGKSSDNLLKRSITWNWKQKGKKN
jgi:hypothetical protein